MKENSVKEPKPPLIKKLRGSPVFLVFDTKDERGKGRLCMLLVSIFGGIATQLSGGFFYTGFLVGYDIDIVGIGIISFVPSICSLLNILTPSILERLKKRRLVLALSRLAYYTINIVGITVLPLLIKNPSGRLWGFLAIVILANSVNALFGTGYTSWHANFLPESMRASYSIFSGCISSCISGFAVLAVSLLTDKLAGSPEQLQLIILFRYIAFFLAILDVIIISLPKEYPYPKSAVKVKLTDVFTLPTKNMRFMLTVLLLCLYSFITSLPNATLNTFLLTEVHVSYSFMNAINASFFLFYIFFGAICRKFIERNTWFKAMAFTVFVQGVTYIFYAFVTAENYSWLLLAVRLAQHVIGVSTNTIIGTLIYVNLPGSDTTNYVSFYSIMSSLSAFISMMLGTVFAARLQNVTVIIIGRVFSSTAILLFVSAVGQILLGVFIMMILKKVTPPDMLLRLEMSKAMRKNGKKVLQ